MRREEASRHRSDILKIVNAAEKTRKKYRPTTAPPPGRRQSKRALTEVDAFPSNVLEQGNGPDDVKPWLARLGARARMVCAISVPHSSIRGTGFLIGPDLVLTCFHVIRAAFEDAAVAGNLEIIFDRESRPDRTGHEVGVSYNLAEDGWLGSFSPDEVGLDQKALAKMGFDPKTFDRAVLEEKLDFAVLRIAGRPGDDRRGGPLRGWINVNVKDQSDVKRGLFVTQIHHPDDTRLLLSFGVIEGLHANGLLSHNAVSFGGSSGGLLVNNFGRFVAMHLGDPRGEKTLTPASRMARVATALSGKITEPSPPSPVD